jgi:hypothetical protein
MTCLVTLALGLLLAVGVENRRVGDTITGGVSDGRAPGR